MFAPKKILVPTDFSWDSDRALLEAVGIAKTFGAKVFLIHVDDRVMDAGSDFALGREEVQAVEAADAGTARRKMSDEIRKVTAGKEVEIEIAERHGTTYEEILAYGKEKGIDLVVIEPHMKKSLMKGLTGRVTDKLIQEAFCPVLVLH